MLRTDAVCITRVYVSRYTIRAGIDEGAEFYKEVSRWVVWQTYSG
jgi:hypothetical protein